MKAEHTRLWRILGFAALLFMAVGQGLHASESFFAISSSEECCQHSDGSSEECPLDHSCCTAHVSGLVIASVADALPNIPCRSHRFFLGDDSAPDGSLREIDYPPQLS